MVYMKTKLSLGIILSVVFFTILSFLYFQSSLVVWQLQKYCLEYSGNRLQFDHISYDKGLVYLENLCLVSKDEHKFLEAEKAILDYHFSFLDLSINADVIVIHPQVHFIQEADFNPLSSAKVLGKKRSGIFSMKGSLVTEGAILHTPDHRQEPFDLKVDFQKESSHVTVANEDFKFMMQQNADSVQGEAVFHHLKLEQGLSWASSFAQPLRFWNVTEGVIDGSITFSAVFDEMPKIEANLSVDDGEVIYPRGGLRIKFPSIKIHFNPNTNMGEMLVANASISNAHGMQLGNIKGKCLVDNFDHVIFQASGDCLNHHSCFPCSF